MPDFSAGSIPHLPDLGDLSGLNVLLRADLNVPLQNGEIADDFRIQAALPTIQFLKDRGAIVTICSHLGRPKGREAELSTKPIAKRLSDLAPGVKVLENLRFSEGEVSNNPAFVQTLIEGQEVYVNDAFGSSHREHASIVGPPQFIRSAAGHLMHTEVMALRKLINQPKQPFLVILGGAKVSDKLGLLNTLVERADKIAIGGAMAFTFLVARGFQVGNSLLEESQIQNCRQLLEKYGEKIELPHDLTALSDNGKVQQVGQHLDSGWKAMDIGPGTAAAFCDLIEEAESIFWNGPMGVFEDPRFESGTRTVAEAVSESSGYSVVGGGDSAAAFRSYGLAANHLSTGGGASLEFLEKGDLPGLAALRRNKLEFKS